MNRAPRKRAVMSKIQTIRQNLQAQGFCGHSDEAYAQMDLPLRLAPALCMTWTAAGTMMASPLVLMVLIPFAALAVVLPGHPFDVIYNHGLRYLGARPALPRYTARRRFALCHGLGLAGCDGLVVPCRNADRWSLGGLVLVAAAFVNVATGFCIPFSPGEVVPGEGGLRTSKLEEIACPGSL